uniref:Uncharacterized protein n=1 Tax=Sphaerodactylus townsendi TaxID=933632 RepID=A0ACB8F9H1_9SAUR
MKHFCIMPTNGSRNSVIKFCSKGFLDKICSKVLFMSGGIGENNVNMVIRSKELKLFDYGPKNLDTYNQTTPPLYKIQEMKVPTVVWSGGKDIMASPKDTEFLLSVLGNVIYYKEIPHWMHYDFLFGLDARQQVYDELVTMIRQIDLIPMK